MRDTVRQVAHLFPTAIISGRGRDKVEAFVQLPELFYAGSHGMDIAGPKVGSCCCWCRPAHYSQGSHQCVYCSNGNMCYGDLPGKGVLLSVHQLMCDYNLLCEQFRQHANAYLCRESMWC